MIPLPNYEPTSDPFKNLTEKLSFYNKVKFIFPGMILVPARLVLGTSCVCMAAGFTYVATIGMKFSKKESKPLSGWRAKVAGMVGPCARGLLFFLGFHRIRVKGKPAPRSEAPVVISNHAAPWEAFALMYFSGATFVSRAENAKIPLFGTVMRGMQTICVDRGDADSRDFVVNEIVRRAKDDRWPCLGIFPEGTTINTKSLLLFRNGAFQPGLPVQPVIVRYPWKYLDPTWSGTKLGLGTMTLRLCAQFYNSMELEYLPVYVPSDAEKADPDLYAANVRTYMSRLGNIDESPYSIEDYFVLCEASKLGIPNKDATLGMQALKSETNLSVTDIKSVMASFKKLDVSRTGKVTFQDFCKAMGIPDTPATRASFIRLAKPVHAHVVSGAASDDDEDVAPLSPRSGVDKGELQIDFRHFLQSVVHISRNITTDDAVKMAFEIVNVKGDGKIVPEELEVMMQIAAPEMTSQQVKELFKKIDSRKVGYVDIFEFGSFMRQNPAYMQLFEHVQREERGKGSNAVLDMLAAREAGNAMTVEEFKDRVNFYKEKEQEVAKLSPRKK